MKTPLQRAVAGKAGAEAVTAVNNAGLCRELQQQILGVQRRAALKLDSSHRAT